VSVILAMQPRPERTFWESNLTALAARDGALAARVAAAAPDGAVSFALSRTGKPVPCLAAAGGPLPLHSLYDPEREGRRLAETLRGSGFLVCLGIGGAYQAAALLSNPDLSGLLMVDRDVSFLRSIMERIDLRALLEDRRTAFLLDATPKEVADRLLSLWVPGLCGNLRTLPLRARVERDGRYFQPVGEAIRSAVDEAAADFSTQSRLGRRWFSNITANLLAAASVSPLPLLRKKVFFVGAGPSLESQVPALLTRGRAVSLVAADTAFPALVAAGIAPDLVVSIDCQHYSTFHFLKGFPVPSFLALDLSSPPLLARLADRRGFFAGGHPFSRFAARHGFPLLSVDTSGGNVSHAALSLAVSLGALEISLFGVDFSYPDGKPYARGTYQYDYLIGQSGRLTPVSQGMARLVFDREAISRDMAEGYPRYTTPQLAGYKDKFEEAARTLTARIRQAPGRGLRLSLPEAAIPAGPAGAGIPRGTAPDPRRFLSSYLEMLRALPMPVLPGMAGIMALPGEERDAWMTVLPLTAWARARSSGAARPGQLLADARETAVGIVSRILGIDDGRVAHEGLGGMDLQTGRIADQRPAGDAAGLREAGRGHGPAR
jgi:hypothetical protein